MPRVTKKPNRAESTVAHIAPPLSAVKNITGLQLWIFSSFDCPVCRQFDDALTLEDFKAAHPDVEVKVFNIADEDGKQPIGSAFDRAYDLSEAFDVEGTPACLFVTKDGGEVDRVDGFCEFDELNDVFTDAHEHMMNVRATTGMA